MKFHQLPTCFACSLLLSTGLLLSGCKTQPIGITPAPRKILFVGDSFTAANGGIAAHVKQLAASAPAPRAIIADIDTKGGATLRILQGKQSVHEKIRIGNYDLIVLQDDLPEYKEHVVTPFFENARLFEDEIRAAGSRTALLMAWPYERLNWIALPEIVQAHRELSRELKIPVAPVGNAFARALAERPSLPMLGKDKEHETIHGTYLAACVIYATIYGESPAGFTYCPPGVATEEAGFLQRIAWGTVQAWLQGQ
jgi:hypothetical protein